jgi:hypothetical protein
MNELKIETGQVTITDTIDNGVEQAITFNFHYLQPVVIAYIATRTNAEPIDVRVYNVTSNGCTLFTQEPSLGAHGSETINYIVVEAGEWILPSGKVLKAGKVSTERQHYSTESFNGDKITFLTPFSASPMILHQISSRNAPSFCSSSVSNISSTSFEITQEKGGIASDPSVEEIFWIAIDNVAGNFLYDLGQTQQIELGVAQDGTDDGVTDTYHQFTFANTYTSAPFVIIKQNSFNGLDGAWARAAGSTTTTYARVFAEEDTVGDSEQAHSDEAFGLLAFSAHIKWRNCLDNNALKMEVGQVEVQPNTGSIFVPFQNEYINPIVVTFTQTRESNDSIWDAKGLNEVIDPEVQFEITDEITIGIEVFLEINVYGVNAGSQQLQGFDISLGKVSGSYNASEDPEVVSYIVVEEGTWELPSGIKIQAGKTVGTEVHEGGDAYTGTNVLFNKEFDATPAIVASAEAKACAVWDISSTGFKVATEVAQSGHYAGAEIVHWIAIDNEDGAFTIDEDLDITAEVKIATTGANVGVDDAAHVYSYANTYSSIPIAIVSKNTVNGLDGAWARGSGTNSTTQIGVYSEEDTIGDSERSHASETFSFLIFSNEFVIDLTEDDDENIDYVIKISPEGVDVNDENMPVWAYSLVDSNPNLKEDQEGVSDSDVPLTYSYGMPLAMSFLITDTFIDALANTILDYSNLILSTDNYYRSFYNNTKSG